MYSIMWLHKFALILSVPWTWGEVVKYISGEAGCFGKCIQKLVTCLKLLNVPVYISFC